MTERRDSRCQDQPGRTPAFIISERSKELAADQDFKTLAAVDQARVLEKLLVPPQTLGETVAEQVRGKHYSLVHGLLASLPVQEVITTNYDDLFETASAAVNREVCVLPYNQAGGGRRWLLKLHGCVNHPEDIVLTRKDYLRYDAERAALAGLVQGLLITHHVLFVGFSLSDDNFHRIADAVRRVSRERFGTSLAVAANRLLKEVWETDLNWVEFGELPDSARNLEIFLDRLAARTVSSANHLFDARYETTLTPSEINLRGQLEALASLFAATPGPDRQCVAWVEVERFLDRVGCPLIGKPTTAVPGGDRQPGASPGNQKMPTLISTPSRIEAAGDKPKVIDEYIGRVNSGHSQTSIAHMRSPGGWVEPGQTPEFEEFTIVLKGMLRVTHRNGALDVQAGQAVIVHAGEWAQYSTPEAEGAEYVAVCLPAFSPATVHRDQSGPK